MNDYHSTSVNLTLYYIDWCQFSRKIALLYAYIRKIKRPRPEFFYLPIANVSDALWLQSDASARTAGRVIL